MLTALMLHVENAESNGTRKTIIPPALLERRLNVHTMKKLATLLVNDASLDRERRLRVKPRTASSSSQSRDSEGPGGPESTVSNPEKDNSKSTSILQTTSTMTTDSSDVINASTSQTDTASVTKATTGRFNSTLSLSLMHSSSSVIVASNSSTSRLWNNTSIILTSSVSTVTPAATAHEIQPEHCLPGTDCAWQLGVGLSFSLILVIVVFLIVSRKYRRFLAASHKAYLSNRNRRCNNEGVNETGANEHGLDLVSIDVSNSRPPEYGCKDELFLPANMNAILQRTNEQQRQSQRLSADAYGSLRRKPLTAQSSI